MAKKRRKGQRANQRSKKVRWLWPFWPLVPVTQDQLNAGMALAKARGEFWSKSFDAMGDILKDWSDRVGRSSSR
jgi:hypothetical protein